MSGDSGDGTSSPREAADLLRAANALAERAGDWHGHDFADEINALIGVARRVAMTEPQESLRDRVARMHSQRVDDVLGTVGVELGRATSKFGSFASAHEGYAVILEEMDELWDEIKADKHEGARSRQRHEATQVAAMAARFLLDVPAEVSR